MLGIMGKNLDPTAEQRVQERYTMPAALTLSRKIVILPSTTPAIGGSITAAALWPHFVSIHAERLLSVV
jgi:hypothetical protein